MKKWAIGIIVFMSAIFLIGISKASALNVDYNTINTNNIDSLTGYTGNYVIVYSLGDTNTTPNTYLIFLNSTTAYIDDRNVPSQYINDICNNEGGCFTRIYATKSSNPRLGYIYTSNDYGNTWNIYSSATNWVSTNPIVSPYIIYTTANLYGLSSGNPLKYSAGYHYIDEINVDSLPHLVYNISVENNGDMALNYYFNTPNNSGVNLILCIRYTVEGNEGFSCTRDFTNNVIHQFKPIYPNNTYYLSYENLDNGNVIYQIEFNVQDYIDSLPEIEKTDIIAEYTYYNQDYLTDSPKALTNLLNVLNAPIQVITDIVLYIWNSLNVYIKLFLIGMFSAVIFSAIIRYIK